ncbi:riboflavin deaminase [Pararhizobium antarcticum]|uniref:Riboflavin deaminase n=1 Tax=Pararhizobium antarcticum TaxID=1798805 RepID=A0A657LTD6_9HYPH|nr:riboflavin deaminase [Rhizobium sp. 58]OJF97795.1 riboflavin deaminase [Pararhizobium antarcticum]
MRRIKMTEGTWRTLLAAKSGRSVLPSAASDAAIALYGPIASSAGPFVLAQVGQSLDGRVATPFGDARDISGPEGIAHLHRCRALVDAVIVGVGTVKADNPRLSVRDVEGPDPVRVIIDCRAELAGDEGVFHDGGAPVILIQSRDAAQKTYPADVIRLRQGVNGLCPIDIIDALAERNLSKILVEGGARTIARFLDMDLVDHLHVSIAPLIIGSGPSGISLPPIRTLSEAHRPAAEIYSLGKDILFDCHLRAGRPATSERKRQKIDMADVKPSAVV